jgi:hypothetical protein
MWLRADKRPSHLGCICKVNGVVTRKKDGGGLWVGKHSIGPPLSKRNVCGKLCLSLSLLTTRHWKVHGRLSIARQMGFLWVTWLMDS